MLILLMQLISALHMVNGLDILTNSIYLSFKIINRYVHLFLMESVVIFLDKASNFSSLILLICTKCRNLRRLQQCGAIVIPIECSVYTLL